MPKVKIGGVEIEVPQGATVRQACELAGRTTCVATATMETAA